MKPDLNSGKPDLRLTAIRDPEQTTPASQLPLPENKTKKAKNRKHRTAATTKKLGGQIRNGGEDDETT